MLLAAVACDAARRACEAAGRKELGAYLRAAKVVPGKATFLTGKALANHELSFLSGEIAAELQRAMAPFCSAPKGWKVIFA